MAFGFPAGINMLIYWCYHSIPGMTTLRTVFLEMSEPALEVFAYMGMLSMLGVPVFIM